jgi:hypothetical protein
MANLSLPPVRVKALLIEFHQTKTGGFPGHSCYDAASMSG